MEKRTFVYGEDCSKCRSLEPFVRMSAKVKNIELTEVEYKDLKDENILTIPTLIVENWESKEYKTDESLVEYIRP